MKEEIGPYRLGNVGDNVPPVLAAVVIGTTATAADRRTALRNEFLADGSVLIEVARRMP